MCHFPWEELPFAELLLYTLRHMHVDRHAAQLHMFLGQLMRTIADLAAMAGE